MMSNLPNVQPYNIHYNKEEDGRSSFHLAVFIIKAVREARSINKIEPNKKVKAIIYAGKDKDLVNKQAKLIMSLKTGIEELEVVEEDPKIKDSIKIPVADVIVYLIGAVDEEKEKARVEKEIANLEKMIISAERRLANKEFTDKAPAEIVKKEKEKLKGWQAELKSLRSR